MNVDHNTMPLSGPVREAIREEFAPLVGGIRVTKTGEVMLDISGTILTTVGYQTYLKIMGAVSELEYELRKIGRETGATRPN